MVVKFLYRSRMFARLLGWSGIWCPKNGQLMKGPSNYFLYAVNLAKEYMKETESIEEIYQIQEKILKDLYDALEYSKLNEKLVYTTKFIQLLLLKETKDFSSIIPSGYDGWKCLEDFIFELQVDEYRKSSSYVEAINLNLKMGIKDFSMFEDWCMVLSELNNTKRPSFACKTDSLFCCIGFKRRSCVVLDECEFYISFYTKFPFMLESFDICFDSKVVNFEWDSQFENFGNFRIKTEKVGKLKIQSIKLNFKRPSLTLRIDETSLQHQQNSEKNIHKTSLEFGRLCQRTLKSMLQIRIEALKPKISIKAESVDNLVLLGSEVDIMITVKNETDFPIICFIMNLKDPIQLGSHDQINTTIKMKIKNRTISITVQIA